MEETREISDAFTEFWKVSSTIVTIFVGSWLLGSLLGFEVPIRFTILTLCLFSFHYPYGLYRNWRCKRIVLTPDGLLISRRFFFWEKFIFVPFDEIESVSEYRLLKIYTDDLIIDFKNETEFGQRVIFKPIRAKWPFTTLIEEISQTAARSEHKLKFDRGETGRLFE